VLREYALPADGERGALVGPRGDIVWICAPRWDSERSARRCCCSPPPPVTIISALTTFPR
jgi:hypothetical protein